MLDQKIGGNVNVNLSNNFNENLKLKGVFNDSVVSGNAVGGKITDDLGKVVESKLTNIKNVESLGGIITLEKALKMGKTCLMDCCLSATLIPSRAPTVLQAR